MTIDFHSGVPPHAGWWVTKCVHFSTGSVMLFWRWWSGQQWSEPVASHESEWMAGDCAKRLTNLAITSWSDYYPAGARVPRINPICCR